MPESENIANFNAPLEKVRVSVEREYAERVAACEERQKMWFVTDSNVSASSSAVITGRERLTKLNEALNSFGLTRSKNQRWYEVGAKRQLPFF